MHHVRNINVTAAVVVAVAENAVCTIMQNKCTGSVVERKKWRRDCSHSYSFLCCQMRA